METNYEKELVSHVFILRYVSTCSPFSNMRGIYYSSLLTSSYVVSVSAGAQNCVAVNDAFSNG